MSAVIETDGLGRRYKSKWALRDCTLAIPEGHVVGLVGPNGAGKTTLLRLAAGILAPSAGTITVLGERPAAGPAELAQVGFVAQDTPVYARMTVADHLRLGGWLNPRWDESLAEERIGQIGLDPKQRAGSLSGGQRAQLALTMAIAKRPELQTLMEAVAAQGLSVVLSSHLVADLERVCDYLIVLVGSRVQITGEVTDLLESHHRLSGPLRERSLPATQTVITESHTDKQSNLLIRTAEPILDPSWTVTPVSVEDLVLAYMRPTGSNAPASPQRLKVVP